MLQWRIKTATVALALIVATGQGAVAETAGRATGQSPPEIQGILAAGLSDPRPGAPIYSNSDKSMTLQPFVFRTETNSGMSHALEAAEYDHRTVGGMASIRPLEQSGLLSVQVVALTGGREPGPGRSPGQAAEGGLYAGNGDGMAGSLRVKSASVGGRLTVAGELAASDVDAAVNPNVNSDVGADDGGPGKSRRSQGYRVEVGWASHPNQSRPARQPGWGLAVSHERREPSFARPLGSSTAQDFEETELSAHIGWHSVDTRLTVSQLADNVEDDGRRPTTRTRGMRGVVSWSPDADILGNGARILGRPSLHLRGEISEDLHTDAPAAVTATKVDRDRQSVEAAASFAYSHWSWDLRHRVTEAEATDAAGRRLINGSQLDVNLPMGDHVRFSPHVGYEREENRTANVHRDALNVGLTTLTSLVADSLDWKVSYRYDTNTLSDGSVDLAGHNLDTSIDWSLAPLDITISLSGAYDYSDGRGDLSSERGSYELLAALSLTL